MLEVEYEFQEEDLLHFNEMRFAQNPNIKQSITQARFTAPAFMAIIGSFY